MKTLYALTAVASIATPAAAQVVQPTAVVPAVAATAAPIVEAPTDNAILRAGTPVALRLMEEVTTKKKSARIGQRFTLEVTAPVEVNGVQVIPAGTPAWGEITGVRNKGMWGKSGKLDARLLFMRVNGRQIRLTGSFDDKGVTGTAGVVGAIALIPIAGFFTTGTSALLPKGGAVNGFVDEDVVLAFKQAAPQPLQVAAAAPAMEVSVPAQSSTSVTASPIASAGTAPVVTTISAPVVQPTPTATAK